MTLRSAAGTILFIGGLLLFIRGFGIGGGAEAGPHPLAGVIIGTVGLLSCAGASFVVPHRIGTKLFANASDVVSLLGVVLCAIGIVRLTLFVDKSPLGPDSNLVVNSLRIRFLMLFGPVCLAVLIITRRLRRAPVEG